MAEGLHPEALPISLSKLLHHQNKLSSFFAGICVSCPDRSEQVIASRVPGEDDNRRTRRVDKQSRGAQKTKKGAGAAQADYNGTGCIVENTQKGCAVLIKSHPKCTINRILPR